ncbi:MAG TPA: monothiol bacilliredoxin BrxC family protein [Thermaerobacter sp.]
MARRLGVRHQSPQALLVQRGAVRWHASHWDITEQSLAAALGRAG